MTNKIKRGSTTQEVLTVPEDVLASEIEKIVVPYRQNGKIVLRKETEGITVDKESHILSFELSEEETLKLRPGDVEFEVDIKYANGSVLRSYIYSMPVHDTLLNEEV